MKLSFRRLACYPLKPVEEVLSDGKVIGLVERQEMDTYKAFIGSGFDCYYLARYLSKNSAVKAILKVTMKI